MEIQENIIFETSVSQGLNPAILTFREFIMHEPLPLTAIHEAIFEFLQGRKDVVVFGAHAVNAYVAEPRMTQDIDMISLDAETVSEELRDYLSSRFHIAVRIRKVALGKGYRLYQIQKSGNRHLADVRNDNKIPETCSFKNIQIIAPADLIAAKVISYFKRQGKPKSGTDWRDIAMLLLTFPELKCDPGPVTEKLKGLKADSDILNIWQELVNMEIQAEDDEDEF